MKSIKFSALEPKIVLGIAAHPDDLEFGAAGTLAKFAAAGAQVYYLLLTDGGKGSSDRTMEAFQPHARERVEQISLALPRVRQSEDRLRQPLAE